MAMETGENRQVAIKLESRQDGSLDTHVYSGEWFRKERSIFIRYSERIGEDDTTAEEVRTLLRFRPGELSIVRRGAIRSEQLFVPGMRRSGSYQSALAAMRLETVTTSLTLECAGDARQVPAMLPEQPPFTLDWQYKLYAEDQLSGRFHIRLHIQEGPYS